MSREEMRKGRQISEESAAAGAGDKADETGKTPFAAGRTRLQSSMSMQVYDLFNV